MSRFSPEQREAILADARATLQRGKQAARPAPPPPRHAEWNLPVPEPAEEPQRLDTPDIDWDARIANAVAAARAEILTHVAAERRAMLEALAEVWNQQRLDNEQEVAAMRGALDEVRRTLAQLRDVMAAERGRTLDLPNPLLARRDVN